MAAVSSGYYTDGLVRAVLVEKKGQLEPKLLVGYCPGSSLFSLFSCQNLCVASLRVSLFATGTRAWGQCVLTSVSCPRLLLQVFEVHERSSSKCGEQWRTIWTTTGRRRRLWLMMMGEEVARAREPCTRIRTWHARLLLAKSVQERQDLNGMASVSEQQHQPGGWPAQHTATLYTWPA